MGPASKNHVGVEPVEIGESASRFSTAVVVLLMFLPVFATVLFGGVDTVTWVFISILWLAIVLLWLADAWRGSGFLLNTSPLVLPLILLCIVGLVQLLPVTLLRSLDPFATKIFVSHLVVYIVFFAACLTYINSNARLRRAALLVVLFGAGMAFLGILQRLANPDAIYGLRQTSQAVPFGPFINQHHFAAFMEMTSGVALGLLFGPKTKRDKRILLGIAVVVMGMATVFTSSRGGLISFTAVLAFVVVVNLLSGRWQAKHQRSQGRAPLRRNAVIAVSAAGILFLIFGTVLVLGGNEPLFRGLGMTEIQEGVTNGRAHFWAIAWSIFLENPVLGAGLDAFGVAFTRHDTWNGYFRVEQAHNDYLQTLADSGIIGLACVVSFVYLLFRKGFRTIAESHGFRRDAALGALGGCFGILIHSFFDFPLRTPANAFFFLLIASIATVSISSRAKATGS